MSATGVGTGRFSWLMGAALLCGCGTGVLEHPGLVPGRDGAAARDASPDADGPAADAVLDGGVDGHADAAPDAAAGCSRRVPEDHDTVAAALALAPAGGTVCVGPGRYVEELTLPAEVSLRGSGPATEIVGTIVISARGGSAPLPAVVSDLRVSFDVVGLTACPGRVSCDAPLDLRGQRLSVVLERTALTGAAPGARCVDLEVRGGSAELVLRDSVCRGTHGVRLAGQIDGAPGRYALEVDRSRFELDGGTAAWVRLGDPEATPVPYDCQTTALAATRLSAAIRNSEIRGAAVGVHVRSCVSLDSAAAADSSLTVLHNTIVGVAAGAEGVLVEGPVAPLAYPAVAWVNNLCWDAPPRFVGWPPAATAGNLTATASPFVDLASGDLRLRPGAAPIDAADPAWPLAVDRAGQPRPVDGDGDGTAVADVGAHEFVP